jgi:hypothetical protein
MLLAGKSRELREACLGFFRLLGTQAKLATPELKPAGAFLSGSIDYVGARQQVCSEPAK